jgi:hypothetical protein
MRCLRCSGSLTAVSRMRRLAKSAQSFDSQAPARLKFKPEGVESIRKIEKTRAGVNVSYTL